MNTNQTHAGRPGHHPLFRLFGFEVKVDISWALLALLIVWTLAVGLFPRAYPDLAHSTYWWMGVAGAAGIFLSIVFHELSHSLVARRFGMPIRGITLFIFGGVAEMEDEPPGPRSEFLMAIAGPLASLFLAGVFFLLTRLGEAGHWYTAVIGVTAYLSYLNTIVAVFNLVPAFPLDGGRMLRAALWGWKRRLTDATRVASRIGSAFAWLLMILGVIAFIHGNYIGGTWWFLIGLFLRAAAVGAYRQMVMRKTLQGESIRRLMTAQPITVAPSVTIERLVEDYFYRYHFKMFPVVEGGRLLGCVTTGDVKEIPRGEWGKRSVGDALQPCSADNTISPDSDTAKVLSRLARPDAPGRLMVAENGRLLGVMSLKDLKSFIALKLDLEPDER
jgi:Zn-dependent protease/predicted transcriptional regulator